MVIENQSPDRINEEIKPDEETVNIKLEEKKEEAKPEAQKTQEQAPQRIRTIEEVEKDIAQKTLIYVTENLNKTIEERLNKVLYQTRIISKEDAPELKNKDTAQDFEKDFNEEFKKFETRYN